MKKFSLVDEYKVDYRESSDNAQNEKETFVSKTSDVIEVKHEPEKIAPKIEIFKKPRTRLRKIAATAFVFFCVAAILYSSSNTKNTSTVLNKIKLYDTTRDYDNFIFPVVMQDPKPFNDLKEADPQMLVSASIWRILLKNKPQVLDKEGLPIITESEMWQSYNVLFSENFHPPLAENFETQLFKFNSSEKNFHIKPCSNQNSYIPYTSESNIDNDKIILKVGYVSPNDKWRTLKNDRPAKPDPTKTFKYTLKKDASGQLHIESIASL